MAGGMTKSEARYPGWLDRLLTHPIEGLENYEQMLDALDHGEGAIKVYVEVATAAGGAATARTAASATR